MYYMMSLFHDMMSNVPYMMSLLRYMVLFYHYILCTEHPGQDENLLKIILHFTKNDQSRY